LWVAPVDGSAPPHEYGPGDRAEPTPDGRWLVYTHEEKGHDTVWRRPVAPDGAPEALWRAAGSQEYGAVLSRDGRWVAYDSQESGQDQVYVRGYPDGAERQLVTRSGGTSPFWAPAGDAIYYTSRDTLFRVPVHAGPALTLGAPRPLFAIRDLGDEVDVTDVAADGRLLATRRSSEDPRRGVLMVEHWSEELRHR
jgi:eukaryotic-like serine/threonine-protein kinase